MEHSRAGAAGTTRSRHAFVILSTCAWMTFIDLMVTVFMPAIEYSRSYGLHLLQNPRAGCCNPFSISLLDMGLMSLVGLVALSCSWMLSRCRGVLRKIFALSAQGLAWSALLAFFMHQDGYAKPLWLFWAVLGGLSVPVLIWLALLLARPLPAHATWGFLLSASVLVLWPAACFRPGQYISVRALSAAWSATLGFLAFDSLLSTTGPRLNTKQVLSLLLVCIVAASLGPARDGGKRACLMRCTTVGQRLADLVGRILSCRPLDTGQGPCTIQMQSHAGEAAETMVHRASDPGAPGSRVSGIVLLSIDALRADRVFEPGGAASNIRSLAGNCVSFRKAYSYFPNTVPSLLSMTRMAPMLDYHDAVGFGRRKSGLEVLAENGFEVGGAFPRMRFFTKGSPVLRGVNLIRLPDAAPGSDPGEVSSAEWQVKTALNDISAWMMEKKRFLYWVHLYEPHYGYMVHEEFDFGTGPSKRYDSEVAYADHWAGWLVDRLKRLDPDRSSIGIVVFADHGEELFDHQGQFHGKALYDEEIHVPLVMCMPGVEPKDVTRPVSLLSLLPTLLDYLGLEHDADYRAESLLPWLKGRPEQDARGCVVSYCYNLPVLNAEGHSFAAIGGRFKLLMHSRLYSFELFDMVADPGESHNLGGRFPGPAWELERCLKAFLAGEPVSPQNTVKVRQVVP